MIKSINENKLSKVSGGCYCRCWQARTIPRTLGDEISASTCASACAARGWGLRDCY